MIKENKFLNLDKSKYSKFTYSMWSEYFKKNKKIQEEHIYFLETSDDLKINDASIFPSLKKFCLGESSTGTSYKSKVLKSNNQDFINTIDLFINEENNHSYFLEIILKANNQELLKHTPLDNCFRILRKFLSLNANINILLTAEIIAITYYSIIYNSTNNLPLKKTCKQMLSDEVAHINFQAYNNKTIVKNSNIKNCFRKGFMFATVSALYVSERKFFKKKNISYKLLMKNSLNILDEVISYEEETKKKV